MRILFGVQGTGNGHISRANAISDELNQYDHIEVDWLLSGREPNELFQVKGHHSFRRGLTFSTHKGQIQYLKTLLSNNVFLTAKDIYELDLEGYDCLVTDYEPILSWAARLRNKPTIGIGHQYAFNYDIPLLGDNFLNRSLLKNFAPADLGLGLHWHHFDQPILPPICDLPEWSAADQQDEKVVVYLPFEDQERVIKTLTPLTNYKFMIYGPELIDQDLGHIHTRALSRHGFKQDLVSSSAVIANTGFELISECLCMGIKVLTKPLHKQVEQLSNGAALSTLGYAEVVNTLNTDVCRGWLERSENVLVTYPSVHRKIAQWLAAGRSQSLESLSEELWQGVIVERNVVKKVPETAQFAASL